MSHSARRRGPRVLFFVLAVVVRRARSRPPRRLVAQSFSYCDGTLSEKTNNTHTRQSPFIMRRGSSRRGPVSCKTTAGAVSVAPACPRLSRRLLAFFFCPPTCLDTPLTTEATGAARRTRAVIACRCSQTLTERKEPNYSTSGKKTKNKKTLPLLDGVFDIADHYHTSKKSCCPLQGSNL